MTKSPDDDGRDPPAPKNLKSREPATSLPAPQGSSKTPYEVGYKKPPRSSRFQKGVSGNPKGRPKDSKNLSSIMEKLLDQPVAIVIDGVKKEVSGREAIATRIFQKALSGDAKSIEILRETDRTLMQEMINLQEAELAQEISSEADQEILEHFINTYKPRKVKSGDKP